MFRQESGKNIGKVATVVKDISKTTMARTIVNNLARSSQAMKMSTNALQKASTSGMNLISAKVPTSQANSCLKDFGESVQKRSLITQAVIQGPSKIGVLSTPKSNFSGLVSSSGKNSSYQLLGQGMNKNLGQTQVPRIENYGLWGAQNNSMTSQVRNFATARQVDFKVSGTSGEINDNYFNQEFSKPSNKDKYSVNFSVTPVWSLPKGSEGSWGFFKPRKPMMVGNLKYNENFGRYMAKDVVYPEIFNRDKIELVLAPTDIHLKDASKISYKNIEIAAQNFSQWGNGVNTGLLTTDDHKSLGVTWTLTGNSTNRTLFNENDDLIALKTKIAIENDMNVILCIGDLLKEKQEGKTFDALARQLSAVKKQLTDSHWGKVVIAYEPEWNVCQDLQNTVEDAQGTAKYIRNWLGWNYDPKVALETRILYGGPVHTAQVESLMKQDDIDGLFVGQKSDKPEFAKMIKIMNDAVAKSSKKY